MDGVEASRTEERFLGTPPRLSTIRQHRGAHPVFSLGGGGIIGQILTKFAISRFWGL